MLDFPLVSRHLREVEENWKDLGRAVAYAREMAGLTQQGLSEMIVATTGANVSGRTIGSLERGQRVAPSTLNRVAAGLGWTPDRPSAILTGQLRVGLAGELHPGGAVLSSAGSGKTANFTSNASEQVDQALLLIEAAEATAIKELYDLLLAIRDALTDEDSDALELIEEAIERATILERAALGRRRWAGLGELTQARNEAVHGLAARRGKKSHLDHPDLHAE